MDAQLLQKVFGFTESDLQANASGLVSSRQQCAIRLEAVKRSGDFLILGGGCLVFLFIPLFIGVLARPPQLVCMMGEYGESCYDGYLYVEGNTPNLIDPSGLCADGDGECRNVALALRSTGINVLWGDTNLLPENLCLEITDYLNIDTSAKLRWTTEEVWSIFNAFKIFATARNNIPEFTSKYSWPPTGNPVNLIKVLTLPYEAAGTTYVAIRTLAFSEAVWSTLPNIQQRSWLVLHEFSHLLSNDLGVNEDTVSSDVTRLFGSLFPSRYAYSGGRVEYLIEAITGTLWNNGYESVIYPSEYDSSAGGRTSFATLDEYLQNPPQEVRNQAGERVSYVVNVRLNSQGSLASEETSGSLEDWIIANVLGASNS